MAEVGCPINDDYAFEWNYCGSGYRVSYLFSGSYFALSSAHIENLFFLMYLITLSAPSFCFTEQLAHSFWIASGRWSIIKINRQVNQDQSCIIYTMIRHLVAGLSENTETVQVMIFLLFYPTIMFILIDVNMPFFLNFIRTKVISWSIFGAIITAKMNLSFLNSVTNRSSDGKYSSFHSKTNKRKQFILFQWIIKKFINSGK